MIVSDEAHFFTHVKVGLFFTHVKVVVRVQQSDEEYMYVLPSVDHSTNMPSVAEVLGSNPDRVGLRVCFADSVER